MAIEFITHRLAFVVVVNCTQRKLLGNVAAIPFTTRQLQSAVIITQLKPKMGTAHDTRYNCLSKATKELCFSFLFTGF